MKTSETPFTLQYDEITNAQVNKQLDIKIWYWSLAQSQVAVHHLQTYFKGHTTGQQIADKISSIQDNGLALERLLMLESDGPNVNKTVWRIVNDALLTLPGRSHGLVDIGTCNLHICHNAFGKGLGVFANEISEFFIDLHWWFKQSAARREDFEAVQQELGLAQHKFLKHVERRWLSLLPAVVRALEQFRALQKYFLLELPRKQRSMTSNTRYIRIKSQLMSKDTVAKIHFLQRYTFLRYEVLDHIRCYDDHETLWIRLIPDHLPRGTSCLIAAVIYHPKQSNSNDLSLREHLFNSLSAAEAKYQNCAFIICGDFNRFNTKSLENHFRLKQIVKVPTRKDATLDLVLTNLHMHYAEPEMFPPFGLSDHNAVLIAPQVRGKSESAEKYTFRRDLRESRKAELGRYLGSIDWAFLFSPLESCGKRMGVFQEVIQTGLDTILPLKKVRFNIKDAPWMNPELKSLILKRQSAFHQHGTDSVPSKFYESRIQHLKNSFERKQCNECKVYLLTLDIPEGFLVSSIIVVYSGFKYKVIISQQQCQHSPFEISKHHYSSININMKVFDTGLNKGLLFINNQPYI